MQVIANNRCMSAFARFELEEFFSDVIEQAFFEGQISGDQSTMIYLWLSQNTSWEH